MSRIAEKFAELKRRGEGALIGYLTLGDPTPESSLKLALCLAEEVDILELGIPFSDPIADGKTIQGAIDRALRAGTNTDHCFEIARELRRRGVEIPLVFMTYYNIVLQYGEERFVARCREVGVDGLLVSDLPVEEASHLVKICRKHGVDMIFLIAPTTTEERMKKILRNASGFIYLVSLLGTTGAREKLSELTIEKTKWALQYVKNLPLAVGFGISKPEHVRAVIEAGASGAVVGSAFVKIVEEKGGEACEELRSLAAELKSGTRPG
jgi:tryptophan synthase alpha chain